VLSRLFRNKFLRSLKKAFRKSRLRFNGESEGLAEPPAFEAFCRKLAEKDWVVYAKPPFGGPEQTLKYLARYANRVAISNSRIISLEHGRVTFTVKDYANGNKTKTITLEAVEFIRRFLIHVVPRGFVRIRQFGFLANRSRKRQLAVCRSLLASRHPAVSSTTPNDVNRSSALVTQEHHRCPVCNIGRLLVIEFVAADSLCHSGALVVQDTS
jgi:hypothetical protein